MCQVDGPNTKSCLNSHFAQQILHPCESHQTLGNVPENASWWQDANCSEYQCIVETCKMPDYLQICCKPETESKNLRLHSMIHYDSYLAACLLAFAKLSPRFEWVRRFHRFHPTSFGSLAQHPAGLLSSQRSKLHLAKRAQTTVQFPKDGMTLEWQ